MKKLLITAFDPFGGSDHNPSEMAVALLPERVGGFELYKCVVPTVYGLAAQKALEAAETIAPDMILCIGVAVGRDAVTPERVALNVRDARIPDNAGNQPVDMPVVEGAPTAYLANVPLKAMVSAIESAGLPAKISNTAGTFVCNDLFFSLRHHFQDSQTQVGFIHVPALEVLSAEATAKALEAAISACE